MSFASRHVTSHTHARCTDVSGTTLRQLLNQSRYIQPLYLVKLLAPHERGEEAIRVHQLVVAAAFHDLPLVERDDAVARPNGGETVGDNDAGTIEVVERVGHDLLGQVSRALVASSMMRIFGLFRWHARS